MFSFQGLGSRTFTKFLASRMNNFSTPVKYIYVFIALILLMAMLEFGQDAISSFLNGNPFYLTESLSYKAFWILFIPFFALQLYLMEKAGNRLSGIAYTAFNTICIPFITLAHLMLFSLFLYGISNLIHENLWSLSFLITEKLSTRLYISLSIYIAFPAIYLLMRQRETPKGDGQQQYSKTIPVKNGQHTVLVETDHIKWISSDGPYLYIHTGDKKHVVLDSLKKFITTLPENFKRIHRSVIVNMDIIKELKSRGNGDYDVITKDGRILRLSRNYTKSLKGKLL